MSIAVSSTFLSQTNLRMKLKWNWNESERKQKLTKNSHELILKEDWNRTETWLTQTWNMCENKQAAGSQLASFFRCCFVVVSLLFESLERALERTVKETCWLVSSGFSLCPVSVLFRSSFWTVSGPYFRTIYVSFSISFQFLFSFISNACASLQIERLSLTWVSTSKWLKVFEFTWKSLNSRYFELSRHKRESLSLVD